MKCGGDNINRHETFHSFVFAINYEQWCQIINYFIINYDKDFSVPWYYLTKVVSQDSNLYVSVSFLTVLSVLSPQLPQLLRAQYFDYTAQH